MRHRLALHTWSLDSTPLAEVLAIARRTGWRAVELRRVDFARAAEAGQPPQAVIDLVRASGLSVACVGGERDWMFAEGPERARVMKGWAESCRWAQALGASVVMSPADPGRGDLGRAARRVQEVGDLAAERDVRLALEANSQAAELNRLARVRELLARADHPCCGLLVDSYHLVRSGDGLEALADLAPEEIFYVQYSDVPPSGLEPGQVLNRLPPGQGAVPFREFFRLIRDKGYGGYLSYEAPNPTAWARPAEEVAREALAATQRLLPY